MESVKFGLKYGTAVLIGGLIVGGGLVLEGHGHESSSHGDIPVPAQIANPQGKGVVVELGEGFNTTLPNGTNVNAECFDVSNSGLRVNITSGSNLGSIAVGVPEADLKPTANPYKEQTGSVEGEYVFSPLGSC